MISGKQLGKYHSILMGVPDKLSEDRHGTITVSPSNQQSFDSSLDGARKWASAVLERVDEKYRGTAHVSIREMQMIPVEVVTLKLEPVEPMNSYKQVTKVTKVTKVTRQ